MGLARSDRRSRMDLHALPRGLPDVRDAPRVCSGQRRERRVAASGGLAAATPTHFAGHLAGSFRGLPIPGIVSGAPEPSIPMALGIATS